jgi:hypothetical protein
MSASSASTILQEANHVLKLYPKEERQISEIVTETHSELYASDGSNTVEEVREILKKNGIHFATWKCSKRIDLLLEALRYELIDPRQTLSLPTWLALVRSAISRLSILQQELDRAKLITQPNLP